MATNLENKIGRIQTNVANALAAIAERGVAVPSGANSDDLETLIKAISSGGGEEIKISSAESTPSANSLTITFEGLTEEPKMFAVQAAENITLSSTRNITNIVYDGETTSGECGYTSGSVWSTTAYSAYSETAYTWEYADGTLTITADSESSGGYFASGITYTLTYATGTVSSGGDGESGGITPSGTLEITENGTYDVTNYASAEVNVSAEAAEPELEEITITENGEYTPNGDGFSKVTVNVPVSVQLPDTITAGDTPVLADWSGSHVTDSTATDTGLSVTVPKAGTWRFYVCACVIATTTTTGTPTIEIYKNGTSVAQTTVSNSTAEFPYFDVECAAGDVIKVYATAVKSIYMTISVKAFGLVACVNM